MVRLKFWQWLILVVPIASMAIFFIAVTGWQIHSWGINWIWGIFVIILVGWRALLIKWIKPIFEDVEAQMLKSAPKLIADAQIDGEKKNFIIQVEETLEEIIKTSQDDPPIWEDWQTFWQRCQDLTSKIAQIYHPEVKYPLLNIYIPQAYSLIRGTVDDTDRWLKQLSPALNQVTIAQAYQGYELYCQLEPSARKLLKIWNWAQWLLNPAVAVAKLASQETSQQANQQLLVNLNSLLREVALRNLCRQAITLYSGDTLPEGKFNISSTTLTLPKAKTKTLQEILSQAQPLEKIAQKPVNILLVGRTGAGKSSVINTLFNSHPAEVDVLPSTAQIKSYHWQNDWGESLTLWDTPGYEQVNNPQFRSEVIDYAKNTDLILLVAPALDPALQMDLDFLKDIQAEIGEIPVITLVTQVDRLRPLREWKPPYNWQNGESTKEISIREAVNYRNEVLGPLCPHILPMVTGDRTRKSWNDDALAIKILETIAPAKQLRLARFFRNLEARTIAAARIIDRYTFQMATSQGLTALLKSPVLQFISTLTTGSPRLALLLAEKIPVEQLPVVIGKLQLAYELFSLLSSDNEQKPQFDLLSLWTLIIENSGLPEQQGWAFGHALVEYWTQNLTFSELKERFHYYLELETRSSHQ
jgi:predicted GTPase